MQDWKKSTYFYEVYDLVQVGNKGEKCGIGDENILERIIIEIIESIKQKTIKKCLDIGKSDTKI